jgi:hypothetical protein
MHCGYDHGKGKCLLAFTYLDFRLIHGEKASQIMLDVKAWMETQDSVKNIGAYI